MRKIISITAVFLGVVLFGLSIMTFQNSNIDTLQEKRNSEKKPIVTVGQTTFAVDLAVTTEEKVQGLSGREELKEHQGMLFIYSTYDRPLFWMRGMKFPIDIIWIKDDKVVDIHENLPVPIDEDHLPTYVPKEAINMVLEVKAGTIQKYGIKEGETIQSKYIPVT